MINIIIDTSILYDKKIELVDRYFNLPDDNILDREKIKDQLKILQELTNRIKIIQVELNGLRLLADN